MAPETAYPSAAVPPAHPARLAAFAILHRLRAGFDERFSYLELGCGDASNLLPLAAQFPGARFVGVDRDEAAVARGEDLRRAAALDNVTLHAADVRAFTPAEGERFDHVVTHGVYSWVPPDAQRRILELSARHLADAGIVYLSFNTLPGWGIRGVVRDLMRMSAARAQGEAARLRAGKGAVARLLRHGLGDRHPYGTLLAAELELVQGKPDGYLLGEYLAEHNEPLHVSELTARAGEHGLRYLAETLPATPDGALEGAVLEDLLDAGHTRVEAEQHLDVVAYRQFRGALFCHQGASIGERPDYAGLVDRGYFAGRLAPTSEEPLLGPGRTLGLRTGTGAIIEADRPLLKAALLVLSRAWPEGLRAPALVSAALGELRERALLDACAVDEAEINRTARDLVALAARRQIELLPWTPHPLRTPGARPFTPLLRRLEAARRGAVTTPRHETLALDAPARVVLELCDGARDAAELARELGAWVDGGGPGLTPEQRAALGRRDAQQALVRLSLARLGELGLLENP